MESDLVLIPVSSRYFERCRHSRGKPPWFSKL